MARIVKEYTVRRNEILDAAQRLLYLKGYERMTTQDIQDELGISRGALYHYFDSKGALLEALIERMYAETEQLLLAIVHDPEMPALEKFRRLFQASGQWKSERKPLVRAVVAGWYADENVLVRYKMDAAGGKMLASLFEAIIRQGIREGVFDAPYPDQAAAAIYPLMKAQENTLIELILAPAPAAEKLPVLTAWAEGCTALIERMLGADPGSLQLIDLEMIRQAVAG